MKIKNKNLSFYVFGLSFFLIVIGILHYRPSPFLFIPLLVSAVVMFLQSRVNRYAFLIGAINSILYAIAYIKMSLYATALYAITVSCLLQIVTFINWQRYTTPKETKLRKMSGKVRGILFGGMLAGWLLLYLIFLRFNSQYLLLDNSVAVLGTISTILCALRFKEYTFLQVVGSIIGIITYILMLNEDPSRIIWVVSSANAIICACIAWINMNKQEEKL